MRIPRVGYWQPVTRPMPASAYETLGNRICPWLRAPLLQLEAAREAGRLGHGWLLAGPRGVGKINLALVAARRLLEGAGGDVAPLQAGEAAKAMAQRHEPMDRHPDLHWVFPGPKRNTLAVEQVREATQALSLTSLTGRAKVMILEPADALTTSAANALLKTLEEPSADTYLLLISHQPGRLPATVRSRCQSLPVRCPPAVEALAWLNGAGADPGTDLWTGPGLDLGPDLGTSPGAASGARYGTGPATGSGSGNGDVDWMPLLDAARGAPFRAMEFHEGSFSKLYKELETTFHDVSTRRLDPQAVADQWLSGDVEAALNWLSARLQSVIRARLAPGNVEGGEGGRGELWDAWKPLPTPFLFEKLENVELLLGRLGGGINVELAVRALLPGFQPKERQR